MAYSSFAQNQVSRIETLLSENVGVKTIQVGNTTVTYEDLLKQREYWRGEVERATGKRPAAKQIDLEGF